MKPRHLMQIFVLLIAMALAVHGQAESAILDLIEKAIQKNEKNWVAEVSRKNVSHPVKSLYSIWKKGKQRFTVNVEAYPEIEEAENQYSHSVVKGAAIINDIGDDANMVMVNEEKAPKIYILTFRKTGAVVTVASESTELVKRIANKIADAIPDEEEYALIVPKPSSNGDFCHVYVVDRSKALKFQEKISSTPYDEEAVKGETALMVTEYPEFQTEIAEETLTTKTFPFPNSKWIITASVYYTDESMGSKRGVDSIALGITVAPKAQANALGAEHAAIAETIYLDNDRFRVKQNVKVGGITYLLGMECRSRENNEDP